jgi:hypothetical protein
MEIATTILSQLGGKRFIAMTGAKNLLAHKDGLSFRLPRCQQGINYVKITLTALDLYTLEFGSIRKDTYTIRATECDIYAEDLTDVFTATTGLQTSL